MPFLDSPHPKVLFTCLTCIGLLAEEFVPDLQKKHGKTVLQKLGGLLNANANKKIVTRALSCCVNFFAKLDEDEEVGKEIAGTCAHEIREIV